MDFYFLNQKSIFDITNYRMNSKTAPQRAVLLFIRYFFFFFISWYKKTSIWVFDIKYQLDFLITNSIFYIDLI